MANQDDWKILAKQKLREKLMERDFYPFGGAKYLVNVASTPAARRALERTKGGHSMPSLKRKDDRRLSGFGKRMGSSF
jgi:hypothetical protein